MFHVLACHVWVLPRQGLVARSVSGLHSLVQASPGASPATSPSPVQRCTPSGSAGPPAPSGLPDEDTLVRAAQAIVHDLELILTKKPNYSMYRPDLVFHDRTRDVVTHDLYSYNKHLRWFQIGYHIRNLLVTCLVQDVAAHRDTGTVHIHWQVRGLTTANLILEYYPKQLWRIENRAQALRIRQEGLSVYHLDGRGHIYRIVYDNKRQDQEQPQVHRFVPLRPKLISPEAAPSL